MVDWLPFGLEFRDPWFLLAALLAPVVFGLHRRIPGTILFSNLGLMRAGPPSLKARLLPVPSALLALAILALAVALAGPRTGDATTKIKRQGIAILMVIDRSGSMDARDFVEGDYSVSRLAALKKVFREFVQGGEAGNGRPNDLIGVVAFGTYADSISPLTLDHDNLLAIVDQMEVAKTQEEASTAIGEGLGLAIERLRLFEEEHQADPVRSKVVILLSDGVNNAGNLDPLQAAELAAANNIQVYTIAAGTTGYVPVPVSTTNGQVRLMRQFMEVDEKTLSQIAQRTGGRHFHARNAQGLQETYRTIDQLERSEISEIHYIQYQEHYGFFVGLALIFMALSHLMSRTLLRRLP